MQLLQKKGMVHCTWTDVQAGTPEDNWSLLGRHLHARRFAKTVSFVVRNIYKNFELLRNICAAHRSGAWTSPHSSICGRCVSFTLHPLAPDLKVLIKWKALSGSRLHDDFLQKHCVKSNQISTKRHNRLNFASFLKMDVSRWWCWQLTMRKYWVQISEFGNFLLSWGKNGAFMGAHKSHTYCSTAHRFMGHKWAHHPRRVCGPLSSLYWAPFVRPLLLNEQRHKWPICGVDLAAGKGAKSLFDLR